MYIENLSDYDEWVEKGIAKRRRMSATDRGLRRKTELIGDIILILYICRKYNEAGFVATKDMVKRLCDQSEEYRKMSGPEKRQIVRDGLDRFGIK